MQNGISPVNSNFTIKTIPANKKEQSTKIPNTYEQNYDLNSVDYVSCRNLVNKSTDLKSLDVIFKNLEGLEGKEFAQKAYTELVKYMGLEDVAPKSITWEKNEGRQIVGDYRFYDNSIVFYTDYFLDLNKSEQLATIAHELTHCKQHTNMLRTEGLSVEKIAYAYAVSDIKAMLVKDPGFILKYMQAEKQGKGKEFLQLATAYGTKKTAQELYQAFADIIELPKHPQDSPNGKKAQQDWIAQYRSNNADLKSYKTSPLEKEAYAFEKIVSNAYKSYNY